MTHNYPDDFEEWDSTDPRSPIHEETPEPDETEEELNFD